MAKILIVDDDRSIIEMLEFLLKKKGYDVSVARDGQEGLAMAQEIKPDLIVLDVMMPLMDGFSVSGALFQDPRLRNIPILILTAKGTSREIFELVPNVRMYMDKPFAPQDLVANIQKLLLPPDPAAA